MTTPLSKTNREVGKKYSTEFNLKEKKHSIGDVSKKKNIDNPMALSAEMPQYSMSVVKFGISTQSQCQPETLCFTLRVRHTGNQNYPISTVIAK